MEPMCWPFFFSITALFPFGGPSFTEFFHMTNFSSPSAIFATESSSEKNWHNGERER